MLKESDQRSDGQRLLKQLRDEYKKAGTAKRYPPKSVPQVIASSRENIQAIKPRSH